MAMSSEISSRLDIATIEFTNPKPERQIGLVWRKHSPRGEEFNMLGEAIGKPSVAGTV